MLWLRLRFRLAMVALAALLLPLLVAARLWDTGGKPESKVARNVLEGKTEGYCSVCLLLPFPC